MAHHNRVSRQSFVILLLGRESDERERVGKAWASFDAASSACRNPEDKSRILGAINAFPGGVVGFNRYVQELAADLLP